MKMIIVIMTIWLISSILFGLWFGQIAKDS